MDAVLATIFDGRQAIRRKRSSSTIKLITMLFYQIKQNPV
jgi:hypothetical protein